MYIKSISVKNFLKHDSSTLTLPTKGIVLITGNNGHGKSSFIEATSFGGWGKSLRKTPLWRKDQKATVKIETHDGLTINRTRKNTKQTLAYKVRNEESGKFDTNTKTQNSLNDHIGDHEIWSKSCVFSSADAATFSSATDAARKKLLETVVGLDKFEPALKKCRADINDLQVKVSSLRTKKGYEETLLKERKERLSEVEEIDGNHGLDLEKLEKEVEEKTKELEALRVESYTLSKLVNQHYQELSHIKAEADATKSKLKDVAHSECPSCGQHISDDLKKSVESDVDAALQELRSKYLNKQKDHKDSSTEKEELEAKLGLLSSEVMQIKQNLSAAKALEQKSKTSASAVAQLQSQIHTTEEAVARMAASLDKAEKELHELEVVKKVLGTKGVRAHLLDQVLNDIEQLANIWLSKVSDGVTLELKPYSEKKTGGTTDSISLNINGWGHGYGYNACSSGERRRIDISLLLAMADIAKGNLDLSHSTIFFDEVFDALDEQGRDSVRDLLLELSEDRCVVLISHDDKLKSLGVTKHIKVHNGSIHS